jgi:3-sulfinopropanoyl-CoA desulfinase
MTRLTAEQEAIRVKARELAAAVIAPRAAEVDRRSLSLGQRRALREAGFFGMTIPKAYGGPGRLPRGGAGGRGDGQGLRRHRAHRGRGQHGRDLAIMAYGTEAQKRLRRGWCWPATSRPSASPSRAPAAPPAR